MSTVEQFQGSVVAASLATAGLLVMLAGCAPATVSVVAEPTTTRAYPGDHSPNAGAYLGQLQLAVTPPVSVSVPELSIDMAIEPHGLDPEGEMSLPVSPFTAGWYAYGSAPDSRRGSTVIAAHVDSIPEGKGPFSRLREAQAGMAITIVDEAGVTHEYRVTGVERIEKAEVPLERVFAGNGQPHLVLVTCGGEFDRQAGSYKDNYIVTAEKVS